MASPESRGEEKRTFEGTYFGTGRQSKIILVGVMEKQDSHQLCKAHVPCKGHVFSRHFRHQEPTRHCLLVILWFTSLRQLACDKLLSLHRWPAGFLSSEGSATRKESPFKCEMHLSCNYSGDRALGLNVGYRTEHFNRKTFDYIPVLIHRSRDAHIFHIYHFSWPFLVVSVSSSLVSSTRYLF